MSRNRPPYSWPYTNPNHSTSTITTPTTLATTTTAKPSSYSTSLTPNHKKSIYPSFALPQKHSKKDARKVSVSLPGRPEKYTPDHRFNPPQFMIIANNDEPITEQPIEETPESPTLLESDHHYFHYPPPPSSPRMVSFLKLFCKPIPIFPVMVGNGANITCKGADLILGLAWLRTLGPILADFSLPQPTFTHGPKAITLRGEPLATPVTSPQLHTLIAKTSVASFHAMYFHFEHANLPISDTKTLTQTPLSATYFTNISWFLPHPHRYPHPVLMTTEFPPFP
ncbi:hypothetical protein LXL04_033106 [Taraxacum kok-saghyz]